MTICIYSQGIGSRFETLSSSDLRDIGLPVLEPEDPIPQRKVLYTITITHYCEMLITDDDVRNINIRNLEIYLQI
jgi:hypothetical protein